MQLTNIIVYAAIGVAAILSAAFKKLTVLAAITGLLIAVCVFKGAGVLSVLQLAAFFVLATAATKIGVRKKEVIGEAESGAGRDARQVLANGGVAALAGLLCIAFPVYGWLFKLMIAGSLAAATADTLSSEIGMVYGSSFFNILTLKPALVWL